MPHVIDRAQQLVLYGLYSESEGCSPEVEGLYQPYCKRLPYCMYDNYIGTAQQSMIVCVCITCTHWENNKVASYTGTGHKCVHIYILLFIPFALAGVALIILMLKCKAEAHDMFK